MWGTHNPKIDSPFFKFLNEAFAHAKRRRAHNNYHEFCLHNFEQ
jgi:hypothetical protein